MILKRLAVALRRQDWLAVFIEFVLVIAGILIALEINDWNDQKKLSQEDQLILKRIEQDLIADQQTIEKTQSFYTEHLQKLTEQRDFLFQTEQSDEDITRFNYGGAAIQEINPRRTTYDEIVSTGRLYKLGNQQLLERIVEYYRLIDYYTYENRQTRDEYRNISYGPALSDYWHWVARPDRDKYALEFFANHDSNAYKVLVQTAGWGVVIISRQIQRNEKLLELNKAIVSSMN